MVIIAMMIVCLLNNEQEQFHHAMESEPCIDKKLVKLISNLSCHGNQEAMNKINS